MILNYFKLDGESSQGENIADNGGLKVAYQAYIEWTDRNMVTEYRLPGLDYKPEQVFWISAANIWCSKYRSEYLKNVVSTDVHSPGEFRVIGTFSNMKEFSNDFNCPIGSRMNPINKCTVW